ncbi:MAG: SAM-dependent methyltransferase [Candidatus Paceibacteria bacterium]|jgi:SAM-dependent methyltransferase
MNSIAYEQFSRLERDHWWFRGRREVYLGVLRAALGDWRPRRILDIGAGVGGFLPELEKLGGELLFTEFDAESAKRARDRGFNRALQASADRLPLADESVDLVCMFDVIEHLERDEQALSEVMRVLRPAGRLVLSVPAHAWLFSRNDEVSGHFRRYSRGELRRKIQGCGLQLDRCTFANSLLFPAIAGVVLARRLGEVCLPKLGHREHTNLSLKMPDALQQLCYRAFSVELKLSRNWDLPLGHSLLAIAEKRTLAARPLVLFPQPQPASRLQPSPAEFASCSSNQR